MNTEGFYSASGSSRDSRRRNGKSKKYFTVYEDYHILTAFRTKNGIVPTNEIVQDLAIMLDREGDSVKERYKKLNGMTVDDKSLVSEFCKNPENNPKVSWIIFEGGRNSRKIVKFSEINPSLYHSDKNRLAEPQDAMKDINDFLDNTEYEKEGKPDQYKMTINLPVEEKLRKNARPMTLEEAYSSTQVMLGKREEEDFDCSENVESRKILREEAAPFGTLHLNTLESEQQTRRNSAFPKYDPEKKIVLTPNNKEEEDTNNCFLQEMLENLAKANDMKTDDVLQFALQLPASSFNFETIHKELQKFKKGKEGYDRCLQKKSQKEAARQLARKEQTLDPIR